ncbi:MAG: DUF58 domain-containing protein [Planctomycetes bacterium]|nr:DUF58 domain-containing protein [Planctomycetota bacterium]
MTPSHDPIDRELRQILAETDLLDRRARWRIDGALSGGYRSSHRGAGVEFDEVREYVPGDDPRSVDWNVTARVGWPFVKKYVDERELTIILVVDVSDSMDDGAGAWSSRQIVARVAATLGLAAARNGDAIGLVAFADEVRSFVPPARGRRHVLRLVRDCLAVRAPESASSISGALDWLVTVPKRRCAVLLLSDFLLPLDSTELARAARKHDVAACHVVSRDVPLPRVGLVRVRDSESGTVRLDDWSDERRRVAAERAILAGRNRSLQTLNGAGIDTLSIESPIEPDPESIRRPVLEFLRTRS